MRVVPTLLPSVIAPVPATSSSAFPDPVIAPVKIIARSLEEFVVIVKFPAKTVGGVTLNVFVVTVVAPELVPKFKTEPLEEKSEKKKK